MARKKETPVEPTEPGFDSVSPEGGYEGPDSETEAAKASMNEPLPEPEGMDSSAKE